MKKILIVDSNRVMLKTLTEIFSSQGGFVAIHTATNTGQALKLVEKTLIDIVITAIRLPKVDGFRLVSKFSKLYPSMKVIVMTRDAHPLLRASLQRYPSTLHLDQAQDICMLTKRVFTELQIDYGGRLRGISISSFLQMIELERCSCTLKVSARDQSGTLWFNSGELIAAKTTKADGKEAALEIMAWHDVYIDIDYSPHKKEQQFTIPLLMLILESSQREDEIRSITANSRAQIRYDLLVAIDYDIKNMTRQCLLRDISVGGAYIETDREVELGQTITLVLTSPRLKSRCSIEAKVVRKDGNGVGVQFIISNPEQQQIVKAMINSCIKPPHQQESLALSAT